jgi:FkbM family methyltransferase
MTDIVDKKLNHIHSQLQIRHGSFCEEIPEQKMSVRYLKGNEKVLEIGGNIGRNSMIISYILNQESNSDFVVLESNMEYRHQLEENKIINHLNFHIESSALSKRNLIQKGWNTIESPIVMEGYQRVNIIDFYELQNKYKIIFDTLVIDCEGAFYYILIDMPYLLTNIKLILMENDYLQYEHKKIIDEILKLYGFRRDYVERGGWGPCEECFFEAWIK